jgi:hypothetical protein
MRSCVQLFALCPMVLFKELTRSRPPGGDRLLAVLQPLCYQIKLYRLKIALLRPDHSPPALHHTSRHGKRAIFAATTDCKATEQ